MGDSYLFHMPRLIDPVGEARDDFAIFTGLASRMGCEREFTEGRSAEQWLRHMYDEFRDAIADRAIDIPDFDELRRATGSTCRCVATNSHRCPLPSFAGIPKRRRWRRPPVASRYFPTPSQASITPSVRAIPAGWRLMNGWERSWPRAIRCTWFPRNQATSCTARWNVRSPTCPVHVPAQSKSTRRRRRARTQRWRPGPGLQRARRLPCARPCQRAISARVVSLPTGAWFDPDDGTDAQGNPNILTRDLGTSRIGQGSSAHTTLVESPPAPTAIKEHTMKLILGTMTFGDQVDQATAETLTNKLHERRTRRTRYRAHLLRRSHRGDAGTNADRRGPQHLYIASKVNPWNDGGLQAAEVQRQIGRDSASGSAATASTCSTCTRPISTPR